MSALDFKEIPEANKATGKQDTFELFARDFLESLGFKILSGPDRGADGGRDLIVSELRVGVAGESRIRWLVSCKHNAHTGKSVNNTQETDILDRVHANNCQGFMGFYSTIASSALNKKLEGLAGIESLIYDCELITSKLLGSKEGLKITKRYFPQSIQTWLIENPTPAKLFSGDETIKCDYCAKDLLNPPRGIYVYLSKYPRLNNAMEVDTIYFACKGACDRELKNQLRKSDQVDGWRDINELTVPTIYLRNIMSIINNFQDQNISYSHEAIEKLKDLLIQTFPHVSRQLNEKDKEKIRALLRIPEVFGGLGKSE